MGKLGTKNIKEKGASVSKSIAPGNIVAKVNSVELDQPQFLVKEDGYFLKMNLETKKPSDDFVGFHTQWDDKNSPTYEGQIGSVKQNSWPYKDSKTPSGVEIDRDEELMRALMSIALSSGLKEWWDDSDGKYDTIEEMVDDLNKELKKVKNYVNICVAGRQYMNKKGYKTWDLFMAKKESGFVSIQAEEDEDTKILIFNRDEHCDYLANQGSDSDEVADESEDTDNSIDEDDDYDDELGF